MKRHPIVLRVILSAVFFAWCCGGVIQAVYAQRGPPGGPQSYPPQQQQYPPSPAPYPHQQPPYPSQGPPAPPQQPQYPSPPAQGRPPSYATGAGPSLTDAMGRFRLNLPQGAVPMGATYNIGIPSAMCQVSIMSVTQDQTFQMQQQNFPTMLKQMGAKVDAEQSMDVGGRPARFIAATVRDQMTGTSMHSMNVFISSAAIWVQVLGPEQNAQQMSQVLQSVLGSLQF